MKTHEKDDQAGFTMLEYIVALVVASIIASMIYTFFGSSFTQSSVPIARLQQVSNLHQVMENIVADYNRLNAINLRYHWQPSIPYGVNAVVTPKTIPSTPNGGHYYISTTAGTSGTTEPTWPTATNGTVTEAGGPTWKESGNIVWQKAHAYTLVGTIVVPINNTGHYYKCTVAGTSGTTEPIWPTATNGIVTETGGPEWTEAGTILSSNEVTIENLFTLLPAVNDTSTRYGTGYKVTEKVFIRFNPISSTTDQEDYTVTENNILKVTIKNDNTAETLTQLFTIR